MTKPASARYQLSAAESLRSPDSASSPDPRVAGMWCPTLVEHHARIAAITLHADVPEKIAIQFETARNLYLYAWHVYRFYMVSKAHALSTLEYGLRSALPTRLPEPYQKKWHRTPMLAGLLGFAIDQGMVRNEGFRRWHQAATLSARERRSMAAFRKMLDEQLESIEIDESEPLVINDEDRRWNLVEALRESLPYVRNELAHGSSMLTSQVLGTLELIAEVLNQVYHHQASLKAPH